MSISLGALLLVLASSLGWGGFDATRKVLAERIRPLPLLFLLTAASVPLFAIWLAVDGMPDVAPGYLLPAAASVVLNVGANLAYIEAVRRSALSLTIPLLSLTPVFTALLAIPLLGERPTLAQAAGILLVVLGALVLSLPGGDRLSPAGAWRWTFQDKRGPDIVCSVNARPCSAVRLLSVVTFLPPAGSSR